VSSKNAKQELRPTTSDVKPPEKQLRTSIPSGASNMKPTNETSPKHKSCISLRDSIWRISRIGGEPNRWGAAYQLNGWMEGYQQVSCNNCPATDVPGQRLCNRCHADYVLQQVSCNRSCATHSHHRLQRESVMGDMGCEGQFWSMNKMLILVREHTTMLRGQEAQQHDNVEKIHDVSHGTIHRTATMLRRFLIRISDSRGQEK